MMWKIILATAFFCAPFLIFKAGEINGLRQANEAIAWEREQHNAFMQEFGVCAWAEVVALETECQP